MSTKQKIILHRYRDGYSERKIARELKLNRETVRRYLAEYERARQKLSEEEKNEEVLIEELVKIPKYDSSSRDTKKFTEEISSEVDRLLQLNEEKRNRGLHKQVLKKIDILEHLQEQGYDDHYHKALGRIGAIEQFDILSEQNRAQTEEQRRSQEYDEQQHWQVQPLHPQSTKCLLPKEPAHRAKSAKST